MGETLKNPTAFSTENNSYGDLIQNEKKPKKIGVKEKIFEDFFKSYVDNEKAEKSKIDESIQNLRLYDTTKSNLHVQQGFENAYLGRRHMMTQDGIPIESVDKLFMANHDMSKYPNILSSAQVGGYVDRFIPYYKDKEITYWSMNLEKGNMYHSHTLGNNPFSKSSGFTQPIQNSKSVRTFHGNVQSNQNSKNIILQSQDDEFSEKYKNSQYDLKNNNSQIDLNNAITQKILDVSLSKGWTGLRKLKLFLRNINKRSLTNLINKNDFKYQFINFGIVFTEKEVQFIYDKFDIKRNNHINFIDFIDSFVTFYVERKNKVENFYEQVKTKDTCYVSFKKLEKLVNFDLHPEVKIIYIIL
jgi:hypothetical protein